MKRALIILGGFIVLLGALLYTATSTQSGLRWLGARIGPLLPAGSRLGELSGRARGPIDVTGARIVAPGFVIDVEQLHVEWAPLELFGHRAHLRRVSASGVRIERTETPPAPITGKPATPLPISVLVDELSAHGVDLLTSPSASPIHADDVALAGRIDPDGVELTTLRARNANAEADGTLDLSRTHPLAAHLRWRLTWSDLPPFAGTLDAHGQGDRIAIEHHFDAPYGVAFTGTLDPDERRLEGRFQVEGVSLDAVRADWPQLAITGAADVDATLDGASTSVTADVTPANGTPIHVEARVRADHERLMVEQASARAGDIAAEAQGEASLRELLAGASPAQAPLDLTLTSLDAPVPAVGHIRGTAHVSGTFEQHALTGEGSLEGAGWARGTWTLAAHGAQRALAIDELQVALASGRASAAGTLDWSAAPRLELRASARDVDPGVLRPGLDGRLNADATVAVDAGARRVALGIDALSGTLRGQRVSGSGSASIDAEGMRFDALEIEAGRARLSASGELTSQATLHWLLDAPDLRDLAPEWSGRLHTEGRVSGSRRTPVIEARVDAGGLELLGIAANAVQGDASVDLSGRQPVRIEVSADALTIAGRHLDRVHVSGGGPLSAHAIDVEAASPNAHAVLRLAGGWDGQDWNGTLERLDIEAARMNPWTLTAPPAVAIGAARVSLSRTCLHDGTSESCAQFDWRAPDTWSAQATLEQAPLAALAPFLPPALDYGGHAAGMLDLAGEGGAITRAEATLAFDPGEIAQHEPHQTLLAWRTAQAQAHLTGGRVLVSGGIELEGSGGITFDASVPSVEPARLANTAMEGHLTGTLTEIPLVSALLPDVSKLSGETHLDLRLAGTLAQPAIYGEASFNGGSAELPRLGITLTDVGLAIHGDGRTLALDGHVQSGDGRLVLSGSLAPGPNGWSGNGVISGQAFRVIDLPDMRADASPDVQVAIDGRRVNVTGEVSIPRAHVAPRELANAIRQSSDVVIVGENPEAEGAAWQVDAEVRFILGADVKFQAFGLDADIAGSVLAADHPGKPTSGSGELRTVEGTYTAYGRQLTLDRGRLLFNGGPIDNPALDARASRFIEDSEQTVGVDVRGTLRKPELRLFSDPPVSQTDALSYLLIGRPASTLSGGEKMQVADASRQVGLSGAGFLAQQVSRRLGIEADVGVENAGDAERASFFVGKYLSPKLYVSYGLGVYERINTLRIRYSLTPQLSLQAESGTEQGADLLYSIDR
jgi:translocation and assembly module TamB